MLSSRASELKIGSQHNVTRSSCNSTFTSRAFRTNVVVLINKLSGRNAPRFIPLLLGIAITLCLANGVYAAVIDYEVPHLSQQVYPDCGESACGPTSMAMVINYYYPSSTVSGYDIYHMGTQTYRYLDGNAGAPAVGYRNVGFSDYFPDTGLTSVPQDYRQFYPQGSWGCATGVPSCHFAGLASSEGAAERVLEYWGGHAAYVGGGAAGIERLVSEIRLGPLLLNVSEANGIAVDGHWVVLRGYDDGNTADYGNDTWYVNDPYSVRGNRGLTYDDLVRISKGNILVYSPDESLTDPQRQYAVLVDNGFIQNIHPSTAGAFEVGVWNPQVDTFEPSDLSITDGNGDHIWLEYYHFMAGDWIYPTIDGQAVRWTPDLPVPGRYAVIAIYNPDSGQRAVSYEVRDGEDRLLGSQDVDQTIGPLINGNGTIGAFNLTSDCYVVVRSMPAGCNADVVRFDYIGPSSVEPPQFDDALQWLRTSQKPDGSWSGSTGITALVLLSFFNAGYLPPTDTIDTDGDGTPDLQEGMAYLAAHFDATTGHFYGDGIYICYDTALCMLAYIAADRGSGTTQHRNVITQAKEYLLSVQSDDDITNRYYGGWGYPRDGVADLSNTQWVVMALDAAYDYLGLTKPSPSVGGTWTNKLLQFLDHCQRMDGGFEYREGDWNYSAGSTSAAGLWSLLLAGLHQPEARITAVQNWISDNYTLDENPGRGSTGLYYYYATLAKAFTMAGWSTITDATGNAHNWYAELKDKLEGLQHADGYWVNSNSGLWEGTKDLCTAYALLALQTQQLPTGQQLSWVLTLHSPGDLHVYDPAGRHVGVNEEFGGIDEDIPGSTYEISATGEQIITLTLLQAGTYRIEIVGTGNGSYTLESEAYQDTLLVSSKSLPGTLILGQVQATTATLTSMEGALTVFIEALQAVPSGLVATPGNAVVEISWNGFQESGFDLAGYNIYRSTASHAGYSRVNDSLIVSTSYNDSGLINDTTYYYAVTAVSSTAEETPYSREISATPVANQPPQVNVLAPVAGEVITGTSYRIQWEASDPDGVSDELTVDIKFSSNSGASWTTVASGEDNDGLYEWDISDLISGGAYVIRVTATDSLGASISATSGVFAAGVFSGNVIVAPNPATGAGVVFFYTLPEGTTAASLMIFNITGRLLFEAPLNVETSRFPTAGTWRPADQEGNWLANGPYVYVLIADGRAIGQGKMVIQQ